MICFMLYYILDNNNGFTMGFYIDGSLSVLVVLTIVSQDLFACFRKVKHI